LSEAARIIMLLNIKLATVGVRLSPLNFSWFVLQTKTAKRE